MINKQMLGFSIINVLAALERLNKMFPLFAEHKFWKCLSATGQMLSLKMTSPQTVAELARLPRVTVEWDFLNCSKGAVIISLLLVLFTSILPEEHTNYKPGDHSL